MCRPAAAWGLAPSPPCRQRLSVVVPWTAGWLARRARIRRGTATRRGTRSLRLLLLKFVLSCRANMSDSGVSRHIAGETLGAATYLPSMATEEFLSCLSRQALER